MNTITRILKLFLTTQTVNPPRFPLHVPNESIADKHPINIQIICRKLRFRCQRTLFIIFRVQDQVRYTMAALTCLCSVETNLTLTRPSPKSFVCNLPDSGRHVTSLFQGLSLSLWRAGRREPWERGRERNFIFIFYKKWRSLANLTERDRIIHLDKDISQIIAKYVHLMFQKRKELQIQ